MLPFIQEFGILFLIIVVISFIIVRMKQPMVLGFVLAGLLFSFFITKGSASEEQIIILSELGITFLLFLMGLEFDLKGLKHMGKDIVIATLLQSVIFFLLALGPALLLGFSLIESIYLSFLFMFSSTLLVVKILENKKETTTLRGRIVLGILIIQDIFAILALTLLGIIQEKSFAKFLLVPVEGLALLAIAFVFARWLLNPLLRVAARYPELLFIFSLGICFLFVEISPLLGFSATIGAFIAGVTLANTEYKTDIYGRLKPLIIFFTMLFFVGLGFQIEFNLALKAVLFTVFLCVINFLVKPFIVYFTLRMRGYDMKTSFISGINLSQLSEFGIIIVASGMFLGILSKEIGAIAILSVITTMIISTYTIKYEKSIFRFFEPRLRKIDERFPKKNVASDRVDISAYNIIFFGYYDVGKEMFSKFSTTGKKIMVIENDPINIEALKRQKIPYVYNSVTNPYFFEHLDFSKTEMVFSSLVDIEDNKMIIQKVKHDNPKAVAILTAKSLKNSLELYANNADYVIYPSYVNQRNVYVLLQDYATDIKKLVEKKFSDIASLSEMDRKQRALESTTIFNIDDFLERLSLGQKKYHYEKRRQKKKTF